MRILVVRVIVTYFGVCVVVLGGEPEMQTREIQISITQGLDAILPCLINFAAVSSAQRDKYNVIWSDGAGRYLSVDEKVMMDHRKYRILHDVPNEWNLQIKGVRSTDAGRYKCQINSNPVQTKYLVLHVNVPPRIVSSETVSVKEGDQLVMYCNVTGNPHPNVTWSKEGKDLREYNGEKFVKDDVRRADSGVYKCVADNEIEPWDDEDIIVDVLYPPSMHIRTNRIGQYKYKSVILECEVHANPAETVTWYKSGNPINDNWKYKSETTNNESEFSQPDGSRTHSLHITFLDRQDFGDYVCMAVNKVGTASAVITVNELKDPTTQTPPSTQKVTTPNPTEDREKTTTSVTYIVDPGSTKSPETSASSNTVDIPDKTDPPKDGAGQKDNLVVVPDSSSSTTRISLHTLLLVATAVVLENLTQTYVRCPCYT